MPVLAPLLLAAVFQSASDADVDAAIQRLRTSPGSLQSGRLYPSNPDRFLWHYHRANGALRSRILYSVHVESPNVTPILREALKEKSPDLRAMAVTYLGRINSQQDQLEERNKLLIPMRKDPSPKVRIVAAKAMRWGLPDAGKYLTEMLKDKDEPTRCVAALSLASIRDKRSIPTLISFLGRQPKYNEPIDFGGVDDVTTALARLGNEAIPHVELALRSKTPKVRSAALFVMIQGMAPKLFEYGKQLVSDPDPNVRLAAYMAVGWERKLEAIPLLLKGLEDNKAHGNFRVSDTVPHILNGTWDARQHSEWPEGAAALKKWRTERGG